MFTELAPGTWTSTTDEQLGVPGVRRLELVERCRAELERGEDWTTPAWTALAEHDAAEGFGTRLAARVLLRRSDGRYLLFRYPFDDGSERWVIPGGGADPGEGMLDAVRREVLEETGAAPTVDGRAMLLLCHLLAPSLQPGRRPIVQYSPVFAGTVPDELPDTAHRTVSWLTREEFAAHPRRPLSDPLLAVMRQLEEGTEEPLRAVWLPA